MRQRNADLPRPSLDELEQWLRSQPLHCAYSGESLSIDTCQIDHEVPLDRGGDHSLANLMLCSPAMNRAKGTMTGSEFHQLLALISAWPDRGADLLRRLRASGTIFGRR